MDERRRFEDLFEAHSRAVQAYCLRRAPLAEAHDAAAEVFAVAWRRRADVPTDAVLPWLYGVAARVLANQRRATRRRSRFLGRLAAMASYPVAGPEEQILRNAADQTVITALESLSASDREIVTLVAWEELTREEAAVALGCSVEAAKKRYQRAISRLKRVLGDDPDADSMNRSALKGRGR